MPCSQRSWLFDRTRLCQAKPYSLLAGVQFLGMNTESRRSYLTEDRLLSILSLLLSVCPVSIRYRSAEFGEMPMQEMSSTRKTGSPAFVVLSNKEKVARAGLLRQPTPTQCVRDDFLVKTLPNAVLHWLLGGSIQWLSTTNAGEPKNWFSRTWRAQLRRRLKHPLA